SPILIIARANRDDWPVRGAGGRDVDFVVSGTSSSQRRKSRSGRARLSRSVARAAALGPVAANKGRFFDGRAGTLISALGKAIAQRFVPDECPAAAVECPSRKAKGWRAHL